MDLDSGAEGGRERGYIGLHMRLFIVRHAETDWNKVKANLIFVRFMNTYYYGLTSISNFLTLV